MHGLMVTVLGLRFPIIASMAAITIGDICLIVT